jgi:transcriptional regulator with XRE-family HTH domain
MNKFAQALMLDREALGLTQGQLAQAIGISQQAIARWEGGQSFPRRGAHNSLINFLSARSEQLGRECLTREAPMPLPGVLSERLQEFLEEQEKGTGPKATPERIEAISGFLDGINKIKAEASQQIEYELIENDVWFFVKEMREIHGPLRDHVIRILGDDATEKKVEQWIKKTDPTIVKKWIDESRELLIKHYGHTRKTVEAVQFERYNHPDRIGKELRENIHAAFWKNIDVMVQRGINSKQHDYFSQNVVAEFKMLHPFRPPSFNINQYAPAVVSLMLAKTMSFGQNKTYFLFLLHNNQAEEDVMAVRMQSLQLDCSSLGIHVLLVKNIKQAAMAIQLAEEMAEGTLNIRNSVRKP